MELRGERRQNETITFGSDTQFDEIKHNMRLCLQRACVNCRYFRKKIL